MNIAAGIMITEADYNENGAPTTQDDSALQAGISFFVGVIYDGNDLHLTGTINSVLRQKTSKTNVVISIFHARDQQPQTNHLTGVTLIAYNNKETFFELVVKAVELSEADYCSVFWSGEELFDGAFDAVGKIFTKYKEINWLTGIQTFRAENGFNVSLGSTALRRWSRNIYERNLYKDSGRYIPAASTFWRRSIWPKVTPVLYFIEPEDFCEDLWLALLKTEKLYTCKIYLSTSGSYDKLNRHSFKRPNYSLLIEDSLINRAKEFFFVNNIPYLRLFYRRSIGFAPVVRFDLNTQSYFLSAY